MDVIGYTRLSEEDKERGDVSLENQEKMIQEFCERQGWKLLKIFSDGLAKSEDWERPEFNKMFALVSEKVVGAIVVKDLTRFTRDQELLQNRIKFMRAYGVKLLGVHGDDYTESIVLTGIRGAIAQEVVEKGRKDQRMMMSLKAREGGMFGRPPLGYKIEKKLVGNRLIGVWRVDPIGADKVRKIFELYLSNEDYTTRDVADMAAVTPSTVLRTLGNKKYIGIFAWEKPERFKGKVVNMERGEYQIYGLKKLIDEGTFNAVQDKLKRKKILRDD